VVAVTATLAAIGPTMTRPVELSAAPRAARVQERQLTAPSAIFQHTAVCRHSRRSSTWVVGAHLLTLDTRRRLTDTRTGLVTTAQGDLAPVTRRTTTSVDLREDRQSHMGGRRRTRRLLDELRRRSGLVIALRSQITGTDAMLR